MGSLVVQDHSPTTKHSKPQFKSKQTLFSERFSESKSLDFSTWVSKNFSKIFTFSLLALTVATLFFLRSAGDHISPPLLQNPLPKTPPKPKIEFPEIHYNSIPPVADKSSPLASFCSDQWIVVTVSDYPSDLLRALVKMNGWQVLAVGNSGTPKSWNLKGVVFLSMEEQTNLGFRVVDYLP